MGDHKATLSEDSEEKLRFIEILLKDVEALERMFKDDLIESDKQRIGVEQELYLVDRSWRPALVAMEALEKINDPHFTTELAKFNLEINLEPILFQKDCLSRLQKRLDQYMAKARKALKELDAHPLLVGILPTLRNTDISLDNMAPIERYYALDKVMSQLKGGEFEFHISGVDELITRHNSVMFESVNTSFQLHLQIHPEEFVSQYNWAKAIAGPVLSSCTFSPILLGKRLWRETRIALFQQSIDIRPTPDLHREISPRVTFGNQWAEKDPVDIFKEDIVRYKILLNRRLTSDAVSHLDKGMIPKLEALMVHNGTIYKWNRACYGVTRGKPHVRIENRYLPSGPTTKDEIANAAFWWGLMNGMPAEYENIHERLEFDEAKSNFLKAARQGLYAQFVWVDKQKVTAQDLILEKLLPIAQSGLERAAVNNTDIQKYLGIIENRVRQNKTGSQWVMDCYEQNIKNGTKEETLVAITSGIHKRQNSKKAVHKWDLAGLDEAGSWINYSYRVDQIMSTNLYAVNEDDYIHLVTSIMNWKHVRHVPVENDKGEIVGLITSGVLVQYLSGEEKEKKKYIKDIMIKNPDTATPDMLTIDALALMREKKVGCLPVIHKNKLVGIVTEHDFVDIASQLFKEILQKEGEEE